MNNGYLIALIENFINSHKKTTSVALFINITLFTIPFGQQQSDKHNFTKEYLIKKT